MHRVRQKESMRVSRRRYKKKRRRWRIYIIVKRDAALLSYRGVLPPVRGIVKAADECNASHASTLAQLRLSVKARRKVQVVPSSVGLP